jgi:hypothetical protein
MSKEAEAARAIAIREHLLPLIRVHGTMQEISGAAGRLAVWKAGTLTCTVRSPFTPWPAEEPPTASYEQAISRQRAKPVLPWALDVWRGRKVLSLQWDDDGRVEVVSFIRGPWEAEALAMGGQDPAR